MRIAKYLLLIVPALLALYVIAPYGDRCSGLAHALAWLGLTGVYAIIFFIQTGIDLYSLVVAKKRFDFVPLIITCIAGTLCTTFWEAKNMKPWTTVTLKGRLEAGDNRDAALTLYANGTFDAFTAYADWSCTNVGVYEWRRDTLVLLRSDLVGVTDSVFTSEYRLMLPDSSLVPVEDGFKPILRVTSTS